MQTTKIQENYALPLLDTAARSTVADEVFSVLQDRILTLKLPPDTKISEAEIASLMGVSRQPVREAFKRLATLGFLVIRPQSGTTVSLISEEAVLRARFIRMALEVQTGRTACTEIDADGLAALSDLIAAQNAAIADQDREKFHTLDDLFHREICKQAGVAYVWDVIRENKAHMDRVRMLTLDTSSQKNALAEHVAILDALRLRAPDAVAQAVTGHLSRIIDQMTALKHTRHAWFAARGPRP
jgi:DNA-binding GntR family transcriptional regulator